MAWSAKGKITRREHFLAEMDAVLPWPRLLRRIEPHYPKSCLAVRSEAQERRTNPIGQS
jgi:hypothetical protein